MKRAFSIGFAVALSIVASADALAQGRRGGGGGGPPIGGDQTLNTVGAAMGMAAGAAAMGHALANEGSPYRRRGYGHDEDYGYGHRRHGDDYGGYRRRSGYGEYDGGYDGRRSRGDGYGSGRGRRSWGDDDRSRRRGGYESGGGRQLSCYEKRRLGYRVDCY